MAVEAGFSRPGTSHGGRGRLQTGLAHRIAVEAGFSRPDNCPSACRLEIPWSIIRGTLPGFLGRRTTSPFSDVLHVRATLAVQRRSRGRLCLDAVPACRTRSGYGDYCVLFHAGSHWHLIVEATEETSDLKRFIARANSCRATCYSQTHQRRRLWQRYGFFEHVLRDDESPRGPSDMFSRIPCERDS